MSNQETQALREGIRALRPWHQNIQITPDVDVRSAFDKEELIKTANNSVGFINPRELFYEKANLIYPNGLKGKRFLDCACNAGGYCFWASELGAKVALGFDVRDHWIKQAEFVRKHRKPSGKVKFEVCDLMDLPSRNLEPVDFTLFKGIFYHLADPILGLKIAGDLTREVLWFNTARLFGKDDNSLVCKNESVSHVMSGVHKLSWIPTGPDVIKKILYWLGFTQVHEAFSYEYDHKPGHGRMEIMAARKPGMLDRFIKDFERRGSKSM